MGSWLGRADWRAAERALSAPRVQFFIAAVLIVLAMVGAHVCRVDRSASLGAGSTLLPPSSLRIAMITHGGIGDPFWDQVAAGAFAAQRELGIELRYDGDGQIAEQVRLVDNVIAAGYDVLIVSLADPDALEDSIRAAVAAGITVMSINSGEERGREFGSITHFGQPDGVAGLGAGERMLEAGVTHMLCVIHEAGNVGLDARCQNAGLPVELAGGRVDVLNVTGTADVVSTINEIQAYLQGNPTIDGVLTLNSGIAELALRAIEGSGVDTLLGTFDVSTAVLEAIEDGRVLFAVDQQAYLQGFLPIVFAYAMGLEQEPETAGILAGLGSWAASGRILTGPGFVDKSNARRFPQLGDSQ